jgi:hypothetical protein
MLVSEVKGAHQCTSTVRLHESYRSAIVTTIVTAFEPANESNWAGWLEGCLVGGPWDKSAGSRAVRDNNVLTIRIYPLTGTGKTIILTG